MKHVLLAIWSVMRWILLAGVILGVALVSAFIWPNWVGAIRANASQMTAQANQPTPAVTPATPTRMPTSTVMPTNTQVPATQTPTMMSTPSATVTQAATVSYSPTSAPMMAVSSITSTVKVTTTGFVSGTMSNGLVHPEFFEGQSTGKEYKASYDVGVKEGQVAIAFGFSIEWQGRILGYPTDKCGLVTLLPGWYEKFSLTDGRYEVYDLPSTQQDFWIKDLARQRAEEQVVHYGCSVKSGVEAWKSGIPAVVWSIVAPPMATITPTFIASTMLKTTGTLTATVKSAVPVVTPTASSIVACKPQRTGGGGTASFLKGDEVWGCTIQLDSGQKCEPTNGQCNCYLSSAPGPGTITTGVICPAPGEVPANVKASPWKPS